MLIGVTSVRRRSHGPETTAAMCSRRWRMPFPIPSASRFLLIHALPPPGPGRRLAAPFDKFEESASFLRSSAYAICRVPPTPFMLRIGRFPGELQKNSGRRAGGAFGRRRAGTWICRYVLLRPEPALVDQNPVVVFCSSDKSAEFAHHFVILFNPVINSAAVIDAEIRQTILAGFAVGEQDIINIFFLQLGHILAFPALGLQHARLKPVPAGGRLRVGIKLKGNLLRQNNDALAGLFLLLHKRQELSINRRFRRRPIDIAMLGTNQRRMDARVR